MPSKITVEDDHVVVIPTNSENKHIFDKWMYPFLNGASWFENSKGHIQAKIGGMIVPAYWLVVGRPPKGFDVDHKDRDNRNNRGQNLRIVTHSFNMANSTKSTNKSGFKGVSWDKRRGNWRATISFNRKQIYIGAFDDKVVAARKYDKKAVELFGECALTNEKLGLFDSLII